jgi:hypothetical protein
MGRSPVKETGPGRGPADTIIFGRKMALTCNVATGIPESGATRQAARHVVKNAERLDARLRHDIESDLFSNAGKSAVNE